MKHLVSAVIGTVLLHAVSVCAAPTLYTGEIAVLKASGKLCSPDILERLPQIDLVLDRKVDGTFEGYYAIQRVKIGKFSGKELSRLTVRYPFFDRERAEGHSLTLVPGKDLVSGTLQEKGLKETAEGCAIDVGEIRLSPLTEDAVDWMQRTAKSYQALDLSSEALNLMKQEKYEKAVPLYQKSLALEEEAQGKESPLVILYLDALANAYGKNGQPEKGIGLLEGRVDQYGDLEAAFLSETIARLESQQGDGLYRDRKYEDALTTYRLAMMTDPAATAYPLGAARALIKLRRFDEAAALIGQVAPLCTEKEQQQELDRVRKELAEAKR